MSRAILLVIMAVLASVKATSMELKPPKAKSNLFDPVLSSKVYIGHVKENERIVNIKPRLYASDTDPSNSLNGNICGYELSLHKHDDNNDKTSKHIPFIVELMKDHAILKVKTTIDKLDCEIKQTYQLFIRAYDCAKDDKRRYSERSSLIITIDDINEFAPVFTHKNYLFKIHQDQSCSSCRVEATDDDCTNPDHRVCDYQIKTANTPFTIDSNGSISVTKPLTNDQYEFDVVAIDCYPTSSDDNTRKISEPAKVTIKVIKTCKPTITGNNAPKLTIQSDHTHIFETVHVDTCDDTCAVENIIGTVTLDTNGIDSNCNLEQCSTVDRQYVLIPEDDDDNQIPQENFKSFDGVSQSTTVSKTEFSGELNQEFTIRMWMKHAYMENNEKENIFCKSDKKLQNRHHAALLIHGDSLKLVIRKGPTLWNDDHLYVSQWVWTLAQINDDQWHSYKISVNYPNKVELSVDDQLFITNDDNFRTSEDFALPVIDGTEDTVFALGACWHGQASHMAQYFHGQLSGLQIEQKEELSRSVPCTQDCQQYLDMPDIQAQPDVEFSSNSNRSVWTLRADSSESYEDLLKHIVYRNTFQPIGPSGQRTVTIETKFKCLGEKYTYNFPALTRRLSIDEIIQPADIELKGDTNFFVTEQDLNQGITLFKNLSIHTDDSKHNEVDLNDCSINTKPELSNNEKFILPNDELNTNSIQKDRTQTGLLLTGLTSIESYQSILRKIIYQSKSPIDRTFSLACQGQLNQISTNEIRIQIQVAKQQPLPVPVAAISSNKLIVDNDPIRDSIYDIERNLRSTKNSLGWPVAVVVCVSVGLVGVLVLYIVVRIRSGNNKRNPLNGTGDDAHSQMEWEDDIGLNIIVNPLDETKKSEQSMNNHSMEQVMHEYEGTTSDEDDEYDCHSQNEYSSEEEDEYECNQIHQKNPNHQLEWDDEAMEYGPKKV